MREKEKEEIERPGEKEEGSDASLLKPATSIVPADLLQRYIAEVRRIPTLTPEEEIDLARQYRETGDREAALRLITANLMLVVRISLKFRRACRNVLDCIQEGNLGLLMAVQKFDPDVGVKFPTYATWWVRAYILKFILDNVRLVRVGTTNVRRRLIHNLMEEKRRLEDMGFTAGPKLLAERFGATEQDVIDVQQSLESADISIDVPVSDEGRSLRADFIASEVESQEETAGRKELQRLVKSKLRKLRSKLNEKELAILKDRILSDDPVTLQGIGERFGITREAVRQAEDRLWKKIKDFFHKELGDRASEFIHKK